MPKVEAWLVEETGELFLHEQDYRARLERVEQQRLKREATERGIAQSESWIADLQRVGSFTDLEQRLMDEFPTSIAMNPLYKRSGHIPRGTIISCSIEARWNDKIGTIHSAPRGKNPDFWSPSYYPGWRGEITIKTQKTQFHSGWLDAIGIHTREGIMKGTRHWCWAFTMWAEDWENMAVMHLLSEENER